MKEVVDFDWAESKRVRSWSGLLKELYSGNFIPDSGSGGHRRSAFVFRGMSDVRWTLRTSLERLGSKASEVEEPALRAFQKYAPRGSFSGDSNWERLAVAQHNGLPTRLLDWTVSPLIAAHFATAEVEYGSTDGVIWCINAGLVRDTLPSRVQRGLRDYAWMFDVRTLDSQYPTLKDFDEASSRRDLLIFFEPPSIDARIENQYAVFSALNGSHKSHDAYLRAQSRLKRCRGIVRRVIIDRSAKAEIRDMLDQNNTTERMLFPGLPGLCDWLRRYYSPVRRR